MIGSKNRRLIKSLVFMSVFSLDKGRSLRCFLRQHDNCRERAEMVLGLGLKAYIKL